MLPMLLRFLATVCVALIVGCGGDSPGNPNVAVKEWARAINERDWSGACEVSLKAGATCERKLRENFNGSRLTFDGPAINGGATEPGEEYFSLSDSSGSTVTVSAVPEGSDYAVRLEAVIEGASG